MVYSLGMSLNRHPVGFWQESHNGFVTTFSEFHKLSDALFSLSNKCACPVIASSWHSLLPMAFQ